MSLRAGQTGNLNYIRSGAKLVDSISWRIINFDQLKYVNKLDSLSLKVQINRVKRIYGSSRNYSRICFLHSILML